MKKGNVMLILGLMVCQMNHWIIYFFPLTLIGLCGFEKPLLISWIVLSLVPMLYCVIRRRTNGFAMFVLSHLVPVGLVYFLPVNSWLEKAMIMLVAMVHLIYSVYLRLKTEDRLEHAIHPCVAVGAAGVGLMFQKFQGTQEWNEQYVLIVIFFLALYLIRTYLEQYLYFLVVNDINKGRIPEKAMFRSGLKYVTTFVAAVVGILFLTSGIGWVGQIAKLLKNILFWILHTLFKPQEQLTEEPIVEQNELTVDSGGEEMMPTGGETFWLWVVLEKIYIAVVYIATVVVIIWLLYTLIRFLYRKFHETIALFNEEPEEGMRDIREKCEVEKVKKTLQLSLPGFFGVKDRIRRIYKKEVWNSRLMLAEGGEPTLLARLTAKECGAKLEKPDLAEMYEKARYSQEDCTAEDVKKAKNA